MPRPRVGLLLITLALAALVPFACVARSRSVPSPRPRFNVVPDMDNQGKYRTQMANPIFVDRRAMRLPVPGTVARGAAALDEHASHGMVGGAYATTLPPSLVVDRQLLERGRQRYEIYCAPCHGVSGYGDGMVARRAEQLQQARWVPPASLHQEPALSRPLGHLFNTITRGIRTMPPYGSQIAPHDRWAIVTYVRALQRSQRASLAEVPAAAREQLR